MLMFSASASFVNKSGIGCESFLGLMYYQWGQVARQLLVCFSFNVNI